MFREGTALVDLAKSLSMLIVNDCFAIVTSLSQIQNSESVLFSPELRSLASGL